MANFNSVQDAVKLFNAGLSGGQHLNQSQEQETNHRLWNQEVNKLKEKIKSAEMAKIEALLELEEAKKTVDHLNHKLRKDEKALDLSSNSSVVRDVTSELGVAKELLQRVVAENESRHDLDVSGSSSNVIVVTSELGFAKESLHRVAEEESELCMLMESLKLEFGNVKKEHLQLKEKEQRETKQALEKLKKEAEDAKRELLLLEEELKIALLEAEEAKAEECINVQESGGGGGLTETEVLRACRDETLKKLEMSEKEIEDIKAATQEALKKAEMAEEATIVVDLELKRRRTAASRIMAESKMCVKSFPSAKEVHKAKSRSKETCLVKC
ncbi:unnamed protein product [Eruca vesicaria subsp. sativa]|uniref:WEB family protein n=1 Tax=Eruca vesicaria subsp. sativa TaxID=29727 RepID=A0ABC8LMD1_ERUVS|nr:unnamed protein product [Eruca vesicaria subsp. sativa]